MKIHLRQRKHSKKGKISLYLEIYKGTIKKADGSITGNRAYEYLNLYLIDKPRTPIDKQHNKETLKLAENIKAKRELEIQNGQYGFTSGFKQSTNFIEYFKELTEKRKQSAGNYGNWDSALKHLIKFTGTEVTFKDVDKKFCEGFKDYLLNEAKTKSKDGKSGKNLSSACAASYFAKLVACLNKAVDEEIILRSPAKNIEKPKVKESIREYLTLNELKALVKTECKYKDLKNAFIFSCLTGLRWSDIQKLQWSEVQKNDTGYKITFHQQKTKGLQYLDISEQAREYLGKEGKHDDIVFTGLRYTSYHNFELQRWVLKAGITKYISFHCARHSFAVLQLTFGTEIYTLSKLLGHRELKTTQIYAKIIDEKKREAVNKIPDLTI
ncbi:MAG TPA: site-specific integrase [Bacteroidia bacterium]|nr:site-specific integrase [Bacteroidia bacterium]